MRPTFLHKKWPFKRGGLSSGVKINTFMLRFTLSSGLSRGGGLSKGFPLYIDFDNDCLLAMYPSPCNTWESLIPRSLWVCEVLPYSLWVSGVSLDDYLR